ncbi:putative MFS family arabinose efflux permease [Kribbella amoyensis]|uniref:Putative MFS family arabinose efflux permease n=1 Tax=Kribbella amoyensis TaxID=996641 RepID=A0A561B317_9ACTN|nr:MFS transporter [Kribbella amoyensis]TWD73259.1 putative MFS family arabinose efflux permease [Kribbella amoyensis]
MRELLKLRGMPSYYSAATLARLGDEMVAFTLVLLVLDRTDSPALAGATGAAYALPAVLTGPLLGAWLDRTAHRRIALGVNQAVLGAVMLTMLAVVGHTPSWVTPALAAIAGTTLPMVSGGFTSMLPSLVPANLLPKANSWEAASFGAATITGPAAAATLAAAVSVEAAATVIAVTATASIFAIARLPALPAAIAAGDRDPFARSVVEGLRHLARTPPLRASTVTTTALMGMIGMLLITLPLHMASVGAPKSAAGYLWTAVELGSVTTALLLGRLQTRWRPEYVVMAACAGYGLAMTTWPLASSFAVLLLLAAVAGLVEGPMLPAMFAARQVYSPVALQGRVSTTAASLRVGAAALGQATAGLLVPAIGTRAALLTIALGLITAAALGTLTTLRPAPTRRPTPHPHDRAGTANPHPGP